MAEEQKANEKGGKAELPSWYHDDGWSRAKLDMPGGGQVHIRAYTRGVQGRVQEILGSIPPAMLEKARRFDLLKKARHMEDLSDAERAEIAELIAAMKPVLGPMIEAQVEQIRAAVTAWPAEWRVEELVELPEGTEIPDCLRVVGADGAVAPKPLPVPRLHPRKLARTIIDLIPDPHAAERIVRGIDVLMSRIEDQYGPN